MFALCDVNPFYASCETVFRPDLRGRPVVVLSNNDGCVIARSADYVEKVKTVKRGGLLSVGHDFFGKKVQRLLPDTIFIRQNPQQAVSS